MEPATPEMHDNYDDIPLLEDIDFGIHMSKATVP